MNIHITKKGDNLKFREMNKKLITVINILIIKIICDILYINLSKTFLDNYEIINKVCVENQVLTIGDDIYLGKGLVVGLSSDFFKRGEILAEYTQKILEEGVHPKDLPMGLPPEFTLKYDLNSAKKIKSFNPSAKFLLTVLGIYN